MKPEKINLTDKGYSIKSDIWSLGISLVSFFLVNLNKRFFYIIEFFLLKSLHDFKFHSVYISKKTEK